MVISPVEPIKHTMELWPLNIITNLKCLLPTLLDTCCQDRAFLPRSWYKYNYDCVVKLWNKNTHNISVSTFPSVPGCLVSSDHTDIHCRFQRRSDAIVACLKGHSVSVFFMDIHPVFHSFYLNCVQNTLKMWYIRIKIFQGCRSASVSCRLRKYRI